MTERSPTRAALLDLRDERHAMREGWVFLDEKCLLLAGEMLRQLARHAAQARALAAAHEAAMDALAAALGRHGLEELQLQPEGRWPEDARLERRTDNLMGVRLQQASWPRGAPTAEPALWPSPELAACRRAFAALLDAAVPLAATAGNLERLSQEYRRSVRRARALQDVLLPESERELRGIETALEELEQQDLVSMRHRPAAMAGAR
ncbi:MAG TPA: V-type ATP synthase subunit D [Burkholderiaceae bacterium]|nr:V-type ATP synthase subunit D [Burkholderiaceae bacterium]